MEIMEETRLVMAQAAYEAAQRVLEVVENGEALSHSRPDVLAASKWVLEAMGYSPKKWKKPTESVGSSGSMPLLNDGDRLRLMLELTKANKVA